MFAYHFCLALPAAFTQPGDHLLAELCSLYACRVRAVKILVIAFNWVVRRPAVAIGSFGPGGRPVNKIGVGLANVLRFFALVVCCQMKVPDGT